MPHYPVMKVRITSPIIFHSVNARGQILLLIVKSIVPIGFAFLQCPYFPRFQLRIETVHRPDNGQSENVNFFGSLFFFDQVYSKLIALFRPLHFFGGSETLAAACD